MVVIKEQIRGLNSLAELNELSQYINQCKTMLGKTSLSVGSDVYVVQKTKRTPGVIKKINQTRAVVDMRGRSYNVPFSMLELM
jgi:hypothetical protein